MSGPRALCAALVIGCLGVALAGCGRSEPQPSSEIKAWDEQSEPAQQTQSSQSASPSAESEAGIDDAELAEMGRRIELLGVGYAADGAYIMVRYKVPPRLAMTWQPGDLYVIDEATGATYDEIPFMPKIGYLIGKPAQEDQEAYVMLVNRDPVLKPGAKVTVVLEPFTQEDVVVSGVAFPEDGAQDASP